MSLFGKIVKIAVNVATLPIDAAKDVITLGGVSSKGRFEPYLMEKLEKIKEDAE